MDNAPCQLPFIALSLLAVILFIPDIQTSIDLIILAGGFIKAAAAVSGAFLTQQGLEYGFKKCTGLSKWSGGFLSDLYADLYVSFYHILEVNHLRLFYAKHQVILCSQWVYLNRPTTQHLRDMISSVVRLIPEIELPTEINSMVLDAQRNKGLATEINPKVSPSLNFTGISAVSTRLAEAVAPIAQMDFSHIERATASIAEAVAPIAQMDFSHIERATASIAEAMAQLNIPHIKPAAAFANIPAPIAQMGAIHIIRPTSIISTRLAEAVAPVAQMGAIHITRPTSII